MEEGTLFEFWIEAQDPRYPGDKLGLYIYAEDYTKPVQLGTDYVTTEDYTEHTVDLSDYAGQSVRIAFVHHNSVDVFRINLDCVHVWKKAAHVHAPVKVAGQKPTADAAGWKDYYQCSCGKLFVDKEATQEIPDLLGCFLVYPGDPGSGSLESGRWKTG